MIPEEIRMHKFFPFLLLLLLGLSAFGQQREFLAGKIATQHGELPFINIINLSSDMGTTNNSNGEFEIYVAEKDTLLFSSVQFESQEIIITRAVLEKGFLSVFLVEKIEELKEVSISDIDLSGNLATDLDYIPTLTQADLGFPMSDRPELTSIERKLKAASNVNTSSKRNPAGLINVSLDGILNRINGRTEKLQKAAANEDLSQIVDEGVTAMPASFFSDIGISQERLRDFVYYCAEDGRLQSLLPKFKRLELAQFYIEKATLFLQERM